MKKLLTLLVLATAINATSQRGIATSESGAKTTLDASSIVDAEATTKGILIPRIVLSATNVAAPVVTPANSLLVYNTATAGAGATAVSPGYYYWDTPSTQWVRMIAASDSVVTIDSAEWIDGSRVGLTPGNIYARKALANGDTVVIDGLGHMGIGTNTPLHAFHILQNSGNSRLVIERNDNLSGGTLVLEQSGNNVTSGLSTGTIDSYSQVNGNREWTSRIGFYNGAANTREGNIGFATSDGTGNPTEKMTLTSLGRVGIGTINPTQKLSVYDGQIAITYPTNTSYSMGFFNQVSNRNWQLYHLASTDANAPNGFMFEYFDGAIWNRRVTIDSNGNMGVGSVNPTHRLTLLSPKTNDGIYMYSPGNGGEISGHDNTHFNVTNGRTTNATISMPNYGLALPQTPTAAETWISGNGGISLFSQSVERVRLDQNGNVGIGTTTPSELLEVAGASAPTIKVGSGGVGTGGTYLLGNSNHGLTRGPGSASLGFIPNTNDVTLFNSSTGLGGNIFLATSTTVGSPLPRLTITANGLVGINTVNPTTTLEVGGSMLLGGQTIAGAVDAIGHFSSGQVSSNSFSRYGYWNGVINTGIFDVGYRGTDGSFMIRNVSSGSENTASSFYITNSGLVSIGTTTPTAKLHVEGGYIRSVNDATNGILGSLLLDGKNSSAAEPNTRSWAIYNMNEYSGAYNGLVFWEYYDRNNNGVNCDDGPTDCNERMIIQNGTGFVGINNFAPTQRLHVNGNIRADTLFSLANTYPDYVFEDYFTGESKLNKEYQFKSLNEIEAFIQKNKHLPGVSSIHDIKKEDGKYLVDITGTSLKNLEKIEELYLHVIEINKQKEQLANKVSKQESQLIDMQMENEILKTNYLELKKEMEEIKQLLKK